VTVSRRDENNGKTKRKREQKSYLGYIRYLKKGRKVLMTNFGACLTRENITIGGSSKEKNKTLAGAHGEGLKAASLVMVRNGHPVRVETSSHYLKFRFCPKQINQFVCRVDKAKPRVIEEREEECRKRGTERYLSTSLTSNVCGDVMVEISNIEFADFKEWLKVSLDLERPSKVIECENGSIILDHEFRGRIYLKGLLLHVNPPVEAPVVKPGEAPVKQFKFSYDLSGGAVDPDRRRLVSSKEEEERLAQIWIEAILKSAVDNISPDGTFYPVKLYVDMLLEEEERHWEDVRNAKYYMTKEFAKAIWQYLRRKASERKSFYHGYKNADTIRIIYCFSPFT
jgi:hypothetical protein